MRRASSRVTADFSSASSEFRALGAFFCNFPNRDLCHSRGSAARAAHGQPAYQILWVRGFRGHTISGRGFNLFKPLRRHFRATPVLPSSPLAPRSRGPKRLGSKDRQSARRSPPGRPWELRNFPPPSPRFSPKIEQQHRCISIYYKHKTCLIQVPSSELRGNRLPLGRPIQESPDGLLYAIAPIPFSRKKNRRCPFRCARNDGGVDEAIIGSRLGRRRARSRSQRRINTWSNR